VTEEERLDDLMLIFAPATRTASQWAEWDRQSNETWDQMRCRPFYRFIDVTTVDVSPAFL